MNILNQYLTQILLALLLCVAAYLGSALKKACDRWVNTDLAKAIVRNAVRFVEQTYFDIHGPEKLRAAMARASEILLEKGIVISEIELVTMIEAAVNEFNNSFWKDDSQGKHENGAAISTGPAVEDSPEPITTATAEEIIADLKDVE